MLTAIDNFIFYLLAYVSIVWPIQSTLYHHLVRKPRRRKRALVRRAADDRLRRSIYRDIMGYECQLSDSQLSTWLMAEGHYERYQEDWRAIQHRYPEK